MRTGPGIGSMSVLRNRCLGDRWWSAQQRAACKQNATNMQRERRVAQDGTFHILPPNTGDGARRLCTDIGVLSSSVVRHAVSMWSSPMTVNNGQPATAIRRSTAIMGLKIVWKTTPYIIISSAAFMRWESYYNMFPSFPHPCETAIYIRVGQDRWALISFREISCLLYTPEHYVTLLMIRNWLVYYVFGCEGGGGGGWRPWSGMKIEAKWEVKQKLKWLNSKKLKHR